MEKVYAYKKYDEIYKNQTFESSQKDCKKKKEKAWKDFGKKMKNPYMQ